MKRPAETGWTHLEVDPQHRGQGLGTALVTWTEERARAAKRDLLLTEVFVPVGDRESHVGFGYGAMAGVGYDRYVSSRWSLGALVRITAYRLYGVDDEIRLVSPSLLFTATYQ